MLPPAPAFLALCPLVFTHAAGAWVTPGAEWETASPESQGRPPDAMRDVTAFVESHGGGAGRVVVTRAPTGAIRDRAAHEFLARLGRSGASSWSENTADRAAVFDYFVAAYGAKYPKAVECLTKDREELPVFYDFPARRRHHLCTTNPIEPTFATIRLRTAKTRGCLSRKTALSMVFKLGLSAQNGWRRLNGSELLTDVVGGVTFKDGVRNDDEVATAGDAA